MQLAWCSRAVEWTPAAHALLSNRTNTFFGHAGSVTRHVQLLTGSAVKVDCLAMEPVPAGTAGLPPVVHEMLAAPLLQREVRESTQGREAVHTGCCFILLLPSCCCVLNFHIYVPTRCHWISTPMFGAANPGAAAR